MALQKLTRNDLETLRGGGRTGAGNPEYVAFFRAAKVGEGGKAIVTDEGTSRANIKNRLNTAAKAAGVSIKFHRSGAEEVVFEIVEAGSVSTRQGRGGRPRKNAAEAPPAEMTE